MGSRAHTASYNRGTIDTTILVSCVLSPLYVHSNDQSVDTSFAATPMAHPLPPSLLFATLVLTRPASKQTAIHMLPDECVHS